MPYYGVTFSRAVVRGGGGGQGGLDSSSEVRIGRKQANRVAFCVETAMTAREGRFLGNVSFWLFVWSRYRANNAGTQG